MGVPALSVTLPCDPHRRHLARHRAHGYACRYRDRAGQSDRGVRCGAAALCLSVRQPTRHSDESSGAWLRDGLNLIIGGPTGVGKTWLACALAHKACRDGYSVRYLRLPRLMEELGLAHGDGRFAKLMAGYAKTDLLILDDWGLAPFTAAQRRDMLELLDDRYGNRSTWSPARCRWTNGMR